MPATDVEKPFTDLRDVTKDWTQRTAGHSTDFTLWVPRLQLGLPKAVRLAAVIAVL